MPIVFLNNVRFTSYPMVDDSDYNHRIRTNNRLNYLKWLNNELENNNINNSFSNSIKEEITSLQSILNKGILISQL